MQATWMYMILLVVTWTTVNSLYLSNDKLFKEVVSELTPEIKSKAVDILKASAHKKELAEKVKDAEVGTVTHWLKLVEKDVYEIYGDVIILREVFPLVIRKPFHGNAELINITRTPDFSEVGLATVTGYYQG